MRENQTLIRSDPTQIQTLRTPGRRGEARRGHPRKKLNQRRWVIGFCLSFFLQGRGVPRRIGSQRR